MSLIILALLPLKFRWIFSYEKIHSHHDNAISTWFNKNKNKNKTFWKQKSGLNFPPDHSASAIASLPGPSVGISSNAGLLASPLVMQNLVTLAAAAYGQGALPAPIASHAPSTFLGNRFAGALPGLHALSALPPSSPSPIATLTPASSQSFAPSSESPAAVGAAATGHMSSTVLRQQLKRGHLTATAHLPFGTSNLVQPSVAAMEAAHHQHLPICK